jgi:hypothetical protein
MSPPKDLPAEVLFRSVSTRLILSLGRLTSIESITLRRSQSPGLTGLIGGPASPLTRCRPAFD